MVNLCNLFHLLIFNQSNELCLWLKKYKPLKVDDKWSDVLQLQQQTNNNLAIIAIDSIPPLWYLYFLEEGSNTVSDLHIFSWKTSYCTQLIFWTVCRQIVGGGEQWLALFSPLISKLSRIILMLNLTQISTQLYSIPEAKIHD